MLRSTTGCVTCRIRRVKCDETKPHCNKCTSTGRNCDGYVNQRISRKPPAVNLSKAPEAAPSNKALIAIAPAPPGRSPSPLFNSEEEGKSFAFFCTNTVPQTNRHINSGFWSRLVLQLSHNEIAVKHAVLALSALQRCYELERESDKSFALKQYGTAVRQAQELVKRASQTGDYTAVLVCALLFHCVENTLSDHVSAKAHLRSGMKLLQTAPIINKREVAAITTTYRRFDFQAMTFWDVSAPYEIAPETAQRLEFTTVPEVLWGFNDSTETLVDLIQWYQYITEMEFIDGRDIPGAHNSYSAQRERCILGLQQWKSAFEDFKARHQQQDPGFKQKALLLEMYHRLASISVNNFPPLPQKGWDAHIEDFRVIIDVADQLLDREPTVHTSGIVSFEIGITIPLFQVAMRCRDPKLRRRAIELLESSKRKEGIWESIGAAKVARKAMEIEENGLAQVENAEDVPENQRVQVVNPGADLVNRKVDVTYYLDPKITMTETGETKYIWKTQEALFYLD